MMLEWIRGLSLPARVLVYGAGALLAFAVAAGVGATVALMLQGDTPDDREAGVERSEGERAAVEEPKAEEPGNDPRLEQETVADQRVEDEYVSKIGDIQSDAVERSLDSHDKLLRYDILTSNDVEELRANEAALLTIAKQTDDLDPPPEHEVQYETFRSAIGGLHEAARLAHDLVADPTAATKPKFDEYDRHLEEANDRLRESNESLDRDYETIGDVREISPL
jgi:hypothetical protein